MLCMSWGIFFIFCHFSLLFKNSYADEKERSLDSADRRDNYATLTSKTT
jgi:hypothetical protein